MTLDQIIGVVAQQLHYHEQKVGKYADDPATYYQRNRDAMRQLAHYLAGAVNARTTDRWDGARVRIAGITATSTSGVGQALRNWLTAARRKASA